MDLAISTLSAPGLPQRNKRGRAGRLSQQRGGALTSEHCAREAARLRKAGQAVLQDATSASPEGNRHFRRYEMSMGTGHQHGYLHPWRNLSGLKTANYRGLQEHAWLHWPLGPGKLWIVCVLCVFSYQFRGVQTYNIAPASMTVLARENVVYLNADWYHTLRPVDLQCVWIEKMPQLSFVLEAGPLCFPWRSSPGKPEILPCTMRVLRLIRERLLLLRTGDGS
jgi:hypothetical protein